MRAKELVCPSLGILNCPGLGPPCRAGSTGRQKVGSANNTVGHHWLPHPHASTNTQGFTKMSLFTYVEASQHALPLPRVKLQQAAVMRKLRWALWRKGCCLQGHRYGDSAHGPVDLQTLQLATPALARTAPPLGLCHSGVS